MSRRNRNRHPYDDAWDEYVEADFESYAEEEEEEEEEDEEYGEEQESWYDDHERLSAIRPFVEHWEAQRRMSENLD